MPFVAAAMVWVEANPQSNGFELQSDDSGYESALQDELAIAVAGTEPPQLLKIDLADDEAPVEAEDVSATGDESTTTTTTVADSESDETTTTSTDSEVDESTTTTTTTAADGDSTTSTPPSSSAATSAPVTTSTTSASSTSSPTSPSTTSGATTTSTRGTATTSTTRGTTASTTATTSSPTTATTQATTTTTTRLTTTTTRPTTTTTRPTTTTTFNPANTYFVATNGSNSNDGSAARPWASILHAIDRVPDGSEIVVRNGRYDALMEIERRFSNGIVVRAENPYRVQLRGNGTVIGCHLCAGITFEGFDISHSGGADQYVVQIQDARGNDTGGRRLTFRNNVFHDSQNNDLIKVNNGASNVLFENNIFYNQRGSDSHIDVNSASNITIRHNVFFNDFGSNSNTGSFIVIKDSNGGNDGQYGSRNIDVVGNVMFNWQGHEGNGFIAVGEDDVSYHHAVDVMIENNLLIGNSNYHMRAALIARAVKDLTFRHNTVVGNLPGITYGLRVHRAGSQPTNENVVIANNIWSDHTGTMGSERALYDLFSDSPTGDTTGGQLVGNLFWNGGSAIPSDSGDLFRPGNDASRVEGDPRLPNVGSSISVPRLRSDGSGFADGSSTVRQAFERLVRAYAVPSSGSPVVNAGSSSHANGRDILGRSRSGADIGAYEAG